MQRTIGLCALAALICVTIPPEAEAGAPTHHRPPTKLPSPKPTPKPSPTHGPPQGQGFAIQRSAWFCKGDPSKRRYSVQTLVSDEALASRYPLSAFNVTAWYSTGFSSVYRNGAAVQHGLRPMQFLMYPGNPVPFRPQAIAVPDQKADPVVAVAASCTLPAGLVSTLSLRTRSGRTLSFLNSVPFVGIPDKVSAFSWESVPAGYVLGGLDMVEGRLTAASNSRFLSVSFLFVEKAVLG